MPARSKVKIDIEELEHLLKQDRVKGQVTRLSKHFKVSIHILNRIIINEGLSHLIVNRLIPDLTGKKFGSLLVLASTPSPKNPLLKGYYSCKCDCSNIKVIRASALYNGCVTSCGSCAKHRDLTGYKFGKWTVIKLAEKWPSDNQIRWQCQCDCGTTVDKAPHTILQAVHKKCSNCANNGRREVIGELTNRYWKRVQDSARARGIALHISRLFAWELFLKQNRKCALTGMTLIFAKSYEGEEAQSQTASLDRIDSNGEYTEDNVQWVHKVVNKLKNDLSDEDLIEWCHKIVNYNKLK